jgi:chromosomal replication initiator protein
MKQELKAYLLTMYAEEEINKWFDPLRIGPGNNGSIDIEFPHAYFAHWYLDNYAKPLTECLHTLFGSHVQVNYRCGTANRGVSAAEKLRKYKTKSVAKDQFGKGYTFEKFILNKKNYFPWISAKEIANIHQIQYNPFLICGEPSTGKTHLVRAIANQISNDFPGKRIFITDVDLLNTLYRSSSDGVLKVRENLLLSDVFILDDTQKLKGHQELQNELVVLFESFHARRRQMVFASQGKGSDLEGLSEPLQSRFHLGLIVNLEQPDFDIRSKFVKQQCRQKKIILSKEQIFTLAQKFHDLRQLQGTILKLHAFKALVNDHIDEHAFLQVVDRFNSSVEESMTLEAIVQAVAEHYDIPAQEILSAKRNGPIVKARQVAVFLCRDLLGHSYPKLGAFFGGRDHSTIIYAVKKINKLRKVNPQLNKEIEDLRTHCHRNGTENGPSG